MANNLAQALKDLHDSWTLKKLVASKIRAAISRTIWNSHSFLHKSTYLQERTAKCLVVEEERSIPNVGV
jgi:hypothetical protein